MLISIESGIGTGWFVDVDVTYNFHDRKWRATVSGSHWPSAKWYKDMDGNIRDITGYGFSMELAIDDFIRNLEDRSGDF